MIEGAQRGGDDIRGEGAEGEGGEGRGVDGSEWIGPEGGAAECSGKGLRQCDSDVGHVRRERGGGGRSSDDMSQWRRIGDIAGDDGRPCGWRLSDVLRG